MSELNTPQHFTPGTPINELLDGFIVCDALKKGYPITRVSSKFCELTGYPRDEIIGQPCKFLQGNDTCPKTIESIRDALKAGKPYRGKILNYRKNGRRFWNFLRIEPLFDGNRLVEFIGLQTDISTIEIQNKTHNSQQLHEVNQALSKTQLLIQSLIKNKLISIFELSAEGHLVSMDEAMADIVGHPQYMINEGAWQEIIHPLDKLDFLTNFKNHIQTKNPQRLELHCRVIAADKSIRYIKSISLPLIEKGNISGYHGVIISLTEEFNRLEISNLYKKILDRSTYGIYVLEPQSEHIIYMNKASRKLLNVVESTDALLPISKLHSLSDQQYLKETVLPILFKKGNWSGEVQLTKTNKQKLPVLLTCCCHYEEPNQPKYISIILYDLRAQKEAQQHDQLRQEQLNTVLKMAFISETASGIAHQLNQPLAVLSSYVQLWNASQKPDPNCHSCLPDFTLIQEQIDKIGSIIHHVNNLFNRRDIMLNKIVNINILLHKLVEKYQERNPSIKFNLSLLSPEQPESVYMDDVLLEQLIKNLINNAIDALIACDQPWIKIEVTYCLGYVQIDIIDNGSGVPAHLHSFIFDPFYTTKTEGSGIGLSLIKTACEIQGGSIELIKTDNAASPCGAHFRLCLKSGAP